MPKFMVDLWMDGYETEAEMKQACDTFIYDQLNMTASSVTIIRLCEICETPLIDGKCQDLGDSGCTYKSY